MPSKVVDELSALIRQQQTEEFEAHLDERIARAKATVAAKSKKGRPLPAYLLRGRKLFHVEQSHETPPELRICKRCGRNRPLALFPPIRQLESRGARNDVCQLCANSRTDDGLLPTHLTIAKGVAKPLPTIGQRATRLLSAARLRAWRLGVPFSMREEWVVAALKRGRCEVTGLPFSEYGRRDQFTASLDRETPSKGYTETNCRMVVWLYNAAKGAGTHDGVLRMARALIDREETRREQVRQEKRLK